jgi:hypothetical protein
MNPAINNKNNRITLGCICNDEEVLRKNLLAHNHSYLNDIIIEKSPPSAAKGINSILELAKGNIVAIGHQDLYLPQQWFPNLLEKIATLEETDPNWAIIGLWGCSGERFVGHIYTTGLGIELGLPIETPIAVQTLDEVMLIINAKHGLRLDDKMRGFHLYGSDICLQAEAKGLKNYVVEAFAVHNSNGLKELPREFWTSCKYMRKKWRANLPIKSPCTTISSMPLHSLCQRVKRRLAKRKCNPGARIDNPSELYRRLTSKKATIC